VRRLARRDWAGVVIERHNATSPEQVGALVAAIRARARRAGRTAPLVAIRQAGGDESALPGLPPAPEGDQAVAREAAAEATAAARALRGLGIDLTLAPIADLAADVGPAAATGFSADPARAADLVAAAVHAYRLAGVASAPGSFPGEGGASQDPRQGPATVGFDLETLRSADMVPFAAAAGEAPAIQMSDAVYAAWDGVTPATLAPEAYDLLRRGAHFGGVALSGDLTAVTAVTGGTPGQAAVDALRAGADLLWIPGDAADQEAAYETMLAALGRDARLRARAAQALTRVALLRARYAATP
jgi:beta-N-acetylhexosaminidase